MNIPINDPGFLGAIVGAVFSLVGAAIGYFASMRRYRTEHETKQRSALAAVLDEMCRNQQELIRELDRVLPLWLSRRHDSVSGAEKLREITTPIPKLKTPAYDAFFTELTPSPFGPELTTYYNRVGHINRLSDAS